MDYHELENMTVNKLREEAKKFPDAKGLTGMKKEELVHFLADKHGLEPPKKRPKKKKAAKMTDKAAIKSKILELKELRKEARDKDEKKKVSILRKRIHTLKRTMRKIS